MTERIRVMTDNSDDVSEVHVLWWTHGDGSGQDVSRVYTDLAKAEADMALLKDHSYVQWRITSLPLIH